MKEKGTMTELTPGSREGALLPHTAICYVFLSVPQCKKTIGVTDWIWSKIWTIVTAGSVPRHLLKMQAATYFFVSSPLTPLQLSIYSSLLPHQA